MKVLKVVAFLLVGGIFFGLVNFVSPTYFVSPVSPLTVGLVTGAIAAISI